MILKPSHLWLLLTHSEKKILLSVCLPNTFRPWSWCQLVRERCLEGVLVTTLSMFFTVAESPGTVRTTDQSFSFSLCCSSYSGDATHQSWLQRQASAFTNHGLDCFPKCGHWALMVSLLWLRPKGRLRRAEHGKEDETEAGKREKSPFHRQILSAAFMLHKMELACFWLCVSTVGVEPMHKQQRYPTMWGFCWAKIELTEKAQLN